MCQRHGTLLERFQLLLERLSEFFFHPGLGELFYWSASENQNNNFPDKECLPMGQQAAEKIVPLCVFAFCLSLQQTHSEWSVGFWDKENKETKTGLGTFHPKQQQRNDHLRKSSPTRQLSRNLINTKQCGNSQNQNIRK